MERSLYYLDFDSTVKETGGVWRQREKTSYIVLEVELTGHRDGLDVGDEEKGGMKGGF